MRYYSFALKTTSDKLKAGAKIILRNFNFDSNIAAMNVYIHQNIKNGMSFFAYREEEDAVLAAFSYDEKTSTFNDAYDHIAEILSSTFSVKQFRFGPFEITMSEFFDHLLEAKRRVLFPVYSKITEAANLEYCHRRYLNDGDFSKYELSEKIISEKCRKDNPMFDESVTNELANIEAHQNTSDFHGNMVHYIISAKSVEAANDITEALMQKLVTANRLSGRRMEIISNIDPDMYKGNNYLENIIENNYGGVMVFDLSEKFGCAQTSYVMTCKYIEDLVKKYKNDCLFVFTYNNDAPGFAYRLLSSIGKYVIPVQLREGSGDRRAAVKYLKELIKDSEYSMYAGQAGEFMKQLPGNKFSHTDVLMAFEQFEPWCLNKNVLHAYDYDPGTPFMLDRDDDKSSAYEKLGKLVGLKDVKEQIDHIVASYAVDKERRNRLGSDYESGTMHMIFGGNPGSAKTTVAKLFAGIAKEKGILKSGAFVERGGMDFEGIGYPYKIRSAFMAAEGGVLFIDEAYSLKDDDAITVLIQEMENRRESVIVILAGYNERMQEFMQKNEGLKSRIPHWVNFPDYNVEELTAIFRIMAEERGFEVTEAAIKRAGHIFERARYMDNFGNGRFVRNLLDQAVQNQSVRLLSDGKAAEKIPKNLLFLITDDDISMPGEMSVCDREPGTARKELNEMIGLSSVKTILSKVIADFKLKKICMDRGISTEKPSLHMSFTGDPGTAKTTVARLFAEIMRDEKILPSGVFVEAGRGDLVSKFVGGTAPLVQQKFKEAQGGVLFIDEAYSLCDDSRNGYGDEAINTIVQEMENHREDVIVIFAGYTDRMQSFLERNPGMASRIAFHVEFEDYSTDELCDITKLQLSRKHRTITDSAMDKLRSIYESAKNDSSFGNGRFVRKMLEEAEMNLAERVSQLDESALTTEVITTITEGDIPAPPVVKNTSARKRVGF